MSEDRTDGVADALGSIVGELGFISMQSELIAEALWEIARAIAPPIAPPVEPPVVFRFKTKAERAV